MHIKLSENGPKTQIMIETYMQSQPRMAKRTYALDIGSFRRLLSNIETEIKTKRKTNSINSSGSDVFQEIFLALT